MIEARNKPLKKGAYLKLKVNQNKGIITSDEVGLTNISELALEKLNHD
ncbi:hypothetical protein [Vagococcus carniphilus]|nr:hypothetical protein [Vagococcus carniphilus]MDT2813338.1 hypothetical protein [Vagococcus carniphilus]MDT2865243.1 hypothetical protein [Vagococcus carniphilus]